MTHASSANLETAHEDSLLLRLLAEARVSYRFSFFNPKPYPRVTFAEWLDRINRRSGSIRNGEAGIYAGVHIEWASQNWIWPVLDIDGTGKSVGDAIVKGKAFFKRVNESGIPFR
jgi:hypothetical protein